MKQRLQDIPVWVINLINLISFIIAVGTGIITIVSASKEYPYSVILFVFLVIAFILFVVIQQMRVLKVKKSILKYTDDTSKYYHSLSRQIRDTYFDVMHKMKTKALNPQTLTDTYKAELRRVLDYLCDLLHSYTEQSISACIKVIVPNGDDGTIDIENATLATFCRSNNSGRRNDHDNKTICLKENTDFMEILDPQNNKDYFYQGDLVKYAETLHKIGREYHNSNPQWRDQYTGTIVVPIWIEYGLIYHKKNKAGAHHTLGFLCVDSKSRLAFPDDKEDSNVDIVHSFADVVYLLLKQYQDYLSGFELESSSEKAEGNA